MARFRQWIMASDVPTGLAAIVVYQVPDPEAGQALRVQSVREAMAVAIRRQVQPLLECAAASGTEEAHQLLDQLLDQLQEEGPLLAISDFLGDYLRAGLRHGEAVDAVLVEPLAQELPLQEEAGRGL